MNRILSKMTKILIYIRDLLEARELSQMIGPFLDPLNAVLKDLDLDLILDDLIPEQPTVWVSFEFPGSNGEILPLLFQVPLKGVKELGILGLYSPPFGIL